jgi:hypothetical protein
LIELDIGEAKDTEGNQSKRNTLVVKILTETQCESNGCSVTSGFSDWLIVDTREQYLNVAIAST